MADRSYGEDLARIHHAGFGDFARGVAPCVLGLLGEAGIDGGRVLELGCGSGVLAARLLEAGYDVVGIDASAAMLELARNVAPGAHLVRGSLHEAALPPSRSVLSVGECIGYVGDPGEQIDLDALFARVAAALEPGGLFLFDLVMASTGEPMTYRSWRSGPDWAVMVDVSEDAEPGVLRRDILAFREVGGAYRRSAETHWTALFSQEQVLDALHGAGLSARAMPSYGSHALAPQRMAFCARRPLSP